MDFSTTRCGFAQKWPNLDYFTGEFGVFEQFLAKSHLVARQNRTFWRFGKNMSATESVYYILSIGCVPFLKNGTWKGQYIAVIVQKYFKCSYDILSTH